MSNNSTSPALDVELTDQIPAGLTPTLANGTVTQGSYDTGSGVWSLGTLAAGSTARLTIEGTVDAGQAGNTITNTTTAATATRMLTNTSGDVLSQSIIPLLPMPTPGPTAQASVCLVPQMSPVLVDASLVSNTGGTISADVNGGRVISTNVSAFSVFLGNGNETVTGNAAGVLRYEDPDARIGSRLSNSYSFAKQIELELRAGSAFGGPDSNMNVGYDRIIFVASGVSPGFTWSVDGLLKGTSQLLSGGQVLAIDANLAAGGASSFTEYLVTTNGTLARLDVYRDHIDGQPAFDSTQFGMNLTDCADEADLAITKTNTPGVNGDVDQASDTVTSGSTTTYTLVVTNNGPDSVTGAVVTDTPTSGLTCPASNAVAITGDGVPAGSFTVGDLTGSEITFGTLANGEATELTFSCTVN